MTARRPGPRAALDALNALEREAGLPPTAPPPQPLAPEPPLAPVPETPAPDPPRLHEPRVSATGAPLVRPPDDATRAPRPPYAAGEAKVTLWSPRVPPEPPAAPPAPVEPPAALPTAGGKLATWARDNQRALWWLLILFVLLWLLRD